MDDGKSTFRCFHGYNTITLKITLLVTSILITVHITLAGSTRRRQYRVSRSGFAPSVPLLLHPREDVGLCQEAELDWSAGVLGEFPAFV